MCAKLMRDGREGGRDEDEPTSLDGGRGMGTNGGGRGRTETDRWMGGWIKTRRMKEGEEYAKSGNC